MEDTTFFDTPGDSCNVIHPAIATSGADKYNFFLGCQTEIAAKSPLEHH